VNAIRHLQTATTVQNLNINKKPTAKAVGFSIENKVLLCYTEREK
jgi:hypothetical protein